MRVYLDVDGVLTDFIGHACAVHGVSNPYLNSKNWGKYALHTLLGMTYAKFIEPMGYSFWRTMPMTAHADLVLEALAGFDVCLLSAPLETFGCLDGKAEHFERRMPDYRYMLGRDKGFCASPRHLLIDDSEDSISRYDGPKFLFPGLWNYKAKLDPISALREFIPTLRASCPEGQIL